MEYDFYDGDYVNDGYKIITMLFTSESPYWIYTLHPKSIDVVWFQRRIGLYFNVSDLEPFIFIQNKIDNKYLYLFMLWHKLPKFDKTPFLDQFYKNKSGDKYDIIRDFLKRRMKMSENDIRHSMKWYIQHFDKNTKDWLLTMGVDSKEWKKYGVDYDKTKEEMTFVETKQGLDRFF